MKISKSFQNCSVIWISFAQTKKSFIKIKNITDHSSNFSKNLKKKHQFSKKKVHNFHILIKLLKFPKISKKKSFRFFHIDLDKTEKIIQNLHFISNFRNLAWQSRNFVEKKRFKNLKFYQNFQKNIKQFRFFFTLMWNITQNLHFIQKFWNLCWIIKILFFYWKKMIYQNFQKNIE